jgi:hypothetical protein
VPQHERQLFDQEGTKFTELFQSNAGLVSVVGVVVSLLGIVLGYPLLVLVLKLVKTPRTLCAGAKITREPGRVTLPKEAE